MAGDRLQPFMKTTLSTRPAGLEPVSYGLEGRGMGAIRLKSYMGLARGGPPEGPVCLYHYSRTRGGSEDRQALPD